MGAGDGVLVHAELFRISNYSSTPQLERGLLSASYINPTLLFIALKDGNEFGILLSRFRLGIIVVVCERTSEMSKLFVYLTSEFQYFVRPANLSINNLGR